MAFYPSVCEESRKKLVMKEDANAVCNPEHLRGSESQQNKLCCHNLEKLYKRFSKRDERLPVESTNSSWMKGKDTAVSYPEISELLQNEARPRNSSTDAFNPVTVSTPWKFMNNWLFCSGDTKRVKGKAVRRRAHAPERNEAHSDYIREKIQLLEPMFNKSFFSLNRY